MKLAAMIAVVLLSGCALYGDDDNASADAGVEEVDAAPNRECEDCALGEWHLAATACDANLELHIRINTDRGVPFVRSLAEPFFAAGVSLTSDGARVYVYDSTGTAWAVELDDDGTAASAVGALDVAGCEWVGSVTVTERVRR